MSDSPQSLFILGRQPALGLAELESLYGPDALRLAGAAAALLDADPAAVNFDRLGGSTKIGRVLATLDTTDWRQIQSILEEAVPQHAGMLDEGKLTIGISAYGLRVTTQAIQATGLTPKKIIKKSGRPVRLVPNKELELNTAQIIHNGLTGPGAWELLLVRDGDKTIMAQTIAVQDIESYTVRDRERPKRDARVGMLPPKLAQTIINLAGGDSNPLKGNIVLDPFCGTGVVLQEAKLMGYEAYGTDLEPRMIDYTRANLDWLPSQFPNMTPDATLEAGDATSHRWNPAPTFVACETYLGRPFTSLPDSQTLHKTISECNLIIRKFLRNIGRQIPSGTRLCLAVPAWQVRPDQFRHLELLDSLGEIGYNRISFEHVRTEELLYYRADQIVARELLVLVKQ